MQPPANPKIYHIVHVDRLESIVSDGSLWCDAAIAQRGRPGTTIGMANIKQRRLNNGLSSRPGLKVGDCVPFYFCPRSVMLYVISRGNHPQLAYRDGQEPVVHLEADLHDVVAWADRHKHRWAFTRSNAGSSYFTDYSDLAKLGDIDWNAVKAKDWRNCREDKQAEFLIERSLPWELIERVGVLSPCIQTQTREAMRVATHRPAVELERGWYY